VTIERRIAAIIRAALDRSAHVAVEGLVIVASLPTTRASATGREPPRRSRPSSSVAAGLHDPDVLVGVLVRGTTSEPNASTVDNSFTKSTIHEILYM
jgi:hypothetical protein